MYILLFLTILMRALVDICFKSAVHDNLQVNSIFDLIPSFSKLAFNPFLWLAIFLAIINICLWTLSLSYFNLNYVYPFTSISFILIILAGKLIFKEHLDKNKLLGICFIIIGIITLLLEKI